jgi:uncharacterized membrane protein YczE
MNWKINKAQTGVLIKKIIICTISVILLGVGVGIDVASLLGTDPIGVFFNGVSNTFHINMGFAANFINLALVIVIFFIDKKYISYGTLIHALIYGICINFGINIYTFLNIPNNFGAQLIMSSIGTIIGFVGLAGFIKIDIGIDVWSALTIILSEKIKKTFWFTKVAVDLTMLLIGYLLKGQVGIMTVIASVIGGPVIQMFANTFDKLFHKMLKSNANVKK